jgi:hypothetical protein
MQRHMVCTDCKLTGAKVMILSRATLLAAGFILAIVADAAPVSAQSGSGHSATAPNVMMMAPGRWSNRGLRAYCNPEAAGFGTWRLGQIEQLVKPDQSQRKAFEDFRAASDKVAQSLSAACPVEVPQTVSARLALMEARMSLMLDAVKTIRPAFDAFYATLTPEQKARLDAGRPRRWFWDRWRG